MYPAQVRLNEAYLKELASGQNTYVYCKELSRRIVIDPSGLRDIKAAIHKTLYAGINKYDKTLGGIFLGYSNIKLIQNKGLVFYDDSFVHLEITADFYVFTPEVGSILTGVVTKTSENHIGCLVHKVFNVSVVNATEQEDWSGCTVQVGQEIQFEITVLEMNGPLPYIRGKFRESPFSVRTSSQNQNLQKKEKGVKKKKKKKLELEVNIDDYSTEYKKKKKKSTSKTSEVQKDADLHGSDVANFDDFATNPMIQMSSSGVKNKRKKSQDDTDDFEHPHKRKKHKTKKITFPEEPELTGENQLDSLCTDSTSVLRTTHHDEASSSTEVVRNSTTTSTSKKHRRKLTLGAVCQTYAANISSKENKATVCEIGRNAENQDTATGHPSPSRKKKVVKLSPVPVLSCSKESTQSGIEYNFEVNCAAFSSSTKIKKKKEKQQIDLLSNASQSQNKLNVIVEENLEQPSKTGVSSARKNKDKERFALEMPNVCPSSFKSNGNVDKNFEEEKTVSLPLLFKRKRKKNKEKFASEPVVEETVTEENVEGLDGVLHLSPSKKRKRSKGKLTTEEKLDENAAVSLLPTKSHENNEEIEVGEFHKPKVKKNKHNKTQTVDTVEQTFTAEPESNSVKKEEIPHLSPTKKKKSKMKTAEKRLDENDAALLLLTKINDNNEEVDEGGHIQSTDPVAAFSGSSTQVEENEKLINAKSSTKNSKHSKVIESIEHQTIDELEESGSVNNNEVSHLSSKKKKKKRKIKTAEEDIPSEVPISKSRVNTHVEEKHETNDAAQILAEKFNEIVKADLKQSEGLVFSFSEGSKNTPVMENIEHVKTKKLSSKESKQSKVIESMAQQIIDEPEIKEEEVSQRSHKKKKNKKKKAEDKLGDYGAALLSPKRGYEKNEEINEGVLDKPKSSVFVLPENSTVIKENVEYTKHNKISSKKSKHNKFKSIENVKEQLINELESDSDKKDTVGVKENADRSIADISLKLTGSIVSGISSAGKKKKKTQELSVVSSPSKQALDTDSENNEESYQTTSVVLSPARHKERRRKGESDGNDPSIALSPKNVMEVENLASLPSQIKSDELVKDFGLHGRVLDSLLARARSKFKEPVNVLSKENVTDKTDSNITSKSKQRNKKETTTKEVMPKKDREANQSAGMYEAADVLPSAESSFESDSRKSPTKKKKKKEAELNLRDADLVGQKPDMLENSGLAVAAEGIVNPTHILGEINVKELKHNTVLNKISPVHHQNDEKGVKKKIRSSKHIEKLSTSELKNHSDMTEKVGETASTTVSLAHPEKSHGAKRMEMSPKKPSESSRSRSRSLSLSLKKQKSLSPEKHLSNQAGSDESKLVTNTISSQTLPASSDTWSIQLSPEPLLQLINAEQEETDEENLAANYKTSDYFNSNVMVNAEDRQNRKSNRQSLLSLNKPTTPLTAEIQLQEENISCSPRKDVHITKGHGVEGFSGFLASDDDDDGGGDSNIVKNVAPTKVSVLKSADELKEITSRLLGLIPSLTPTSSKNTGKGKEASSKVAKTQDEISEFHSDKLSPVVKQSREVSEFTLSQSGKGSSKSKELRKYSDTDKGKQKDKGPKEHKKHKTKLKNSVFSSDSKSNTSEVDKIREQLLKSCLSRFTIE